MYPRGKRVNATLECLLYKSSLIAMSHTIQMCTCGVLKYASLIKRGNLTTIHQFHSLCVAVPAQNRSILSRETPTALNYGAIVSWLHAGFTIKSVLLQNISIKKCIFIHDISFINTVLLYVHRNTAVSRSPLAGSTNPLLVLSAVTSLWARWRLKSSASRLFSQSFVQAQIKENSKAPCHWP